jgi:hypothetical protein
VATSSTYSCCCRYVLLLSKKFSVDLEATLVLSYLPSHLHMDRVFLMKRLYDPPSIVLKNIAE